MPSFVHNAFFFSENYYPIMVVWFFQILGNTNILMVDIYFWGHVLKLDLLTYYVRWYPVLIVLTFPFIHMSYELRGIEIDFMQEHVYIYMYKTLIDFRTIDYKSKVYESWAVLYGPNNNPIHFLNNNIFFDDFWKPK